MINLGLNLLKYAPRAFAGVRSILGDPVKSSGLITGGILGGKATNDTINSGILGDTNLMEEGMNFFSSPAISYLKDIRNTPSGSVLAPDQDAIDKENEFNKELNTKITTASEDNQSNILITPEVEQQSGLLSTPENNPIDFSNTTPLPDQSLLSDYIMTASEAEEPTTTDEGLLSETKNPYYSVLAENVLDMNFTSGTGDQILNQIINMPGVKKSELEDTGLSTFLSGKSKVTKEELDNYILENNISTKIVDTILGEQGSAKKIAFVNGEDNLPDALYGVESLDEAKNIVMNDYELYKDFQKFYEADAKDRVFIDHSSGITQYLPKEEVPFEELEEFERPLKDYLYYRFGMTERLDRISFEPTYYSKYTLPGGENYREMLISVPTEGKPYVSKHFLDQVPEGHNLIAHVRYNDREIDGQKTLFVEEIQSDLHQEGRKKGYMDNSPDGSLALKKKELEDKIFSKELEMRDILAESNNLQIQKRNMGIDEYRSEYKRIDNLRSKSNREKIELERELQNLLKENTKVSDAPFKKNWYELAIKRIIKLAVDNGYDAISFTSGEIQKDRYNLSKYIDKVEVLPSLKKSDLIALHTYDKENHKTVYNVKPENIDQYVGKELGEKILKDIEDSNNFNNFNLNEYLSQPQEDNSGVDFIKNNALVYNNTDLEIGGEGMIGFYDKILPSFINKFSKKYGASLEETSIGSGKEDAVTFGGRSSNYNYENTRLREAETLGDVYKIVNSNEYLTSEFHLYLRDELNESDVDALLENSSKSDIESYMMDWLSKDYGMEVGSQTKKKVPILKITPEMKQEIGKKGINIAKLNSGLLSVA